MTQIMKLRFELKNGNFMLSKLTDMETGKAIPIESIEINLSVHNWQSGAWATIKVPIEEIVIEDMPTEIKK